MTELNSKKYEDLLKEPLSCFKCGASMKNMPTLKEHLQAEWDKQAAKAKLKRPMTSKRKVDEDDGESTGKPSSEIGPHADPEETPSKKVRRH